MATSNLLPIQSANGNLVDKKTGEIRPIKYLEGSPRQYRFDASRGILSINGETPLTKRGEEFTILPIAYQIFTDNILGEQYGTLRWVEFIFLNQENQICSVLLHGYSVENLMRMFNEMFYDDVSFCEVALTIKPQEKISTSAETPNTKYFMCFFSYQKLKAEEQELLKTVTTDFRLYRADTYTASRKVELTKNYFNPIADAVATISNTKVVQIAEKQVATATKEVTKATKEVATAK